MGKNSNIEWTHHTANLWWGCSKVHLGCDNCYAEELAVNRRKKNVWGKDAPRMVVKSVWNNLEKWQKEAEALGEIHRVFVGSMMDIFEKSMPMIDNKGNEINLATGILRESFFRNVVPNSKNLQFLLLTKRPSNINKMIPLDWIQNPPHNVIFGTSASDQETYDNMTNHLKKVNGRRFVSVEPQVAEIKIGNEFGIDWIIQGGESGKNKRPFDLKWAYSLRQECKKRDIPYFFKQIDKVQKVPDWLVSSRKFARDLVVLDDGYILEKIDKVETLEKFRKYPVFGIDLKEQSETLIDSIKQIANFELFGIESRLNS